MKKQIEKLKKQLKEDQCYESGLKDEARCGHCQRLEITIKTLEKLNEK